MILTKELCGDYVLTVTGTVDIQLTDVVTGDVLVDTSITDEYTFSVDDGIYTIDVSGEGTVYFIENCSLFRCQEKLITYLLCIDCNGEYALQYKDTLNQIVMLLDNVMLLLSPTWANKFYGYSPEQIEDMQDSSDLSDIWNTLQDLGDTCGCTDTDQYDRVYPYIFYDTDLVDGSGLLSDVVDFLVAGQNKLFDFLKNGYSYELYGYSDNTYIKRMNMVHYLLLWMIMYHIDQRNDLALGEVYTDEEYRESYSIECIIHTFRCEGINVKPMIQAFGLYS